MPNANGRQANTHGQRLRENLRSDPDDYPRPEGNRTPMSEHHSQASILRFWRDFEIFEPQGIPNPGKKDYVLDLRLGHVKCVTITLEVDWLCIVGSPGEGLSDHAEARPVHQRVPAEIAVRGDLDPGPFGIAGAAGQIPVLGEPLQLGFADLGGEQV